MFYKGDVELKGTGLWKIEGAFPEVQIGTRLADLLNKYEKIQQYKIIPQRANDCMLVHRLPIRPKS